MIIRAAKTFRWSFALGLVGLVMCTHIAKVATMARAISEDFSARLVQESGLLEDYSAKQDWFSLRSLLWKIKPKAVSFLQFSPSQEADSFNTPLMIGDLVADQAYSLKYDRTIYWRGRNVAQVKYSVDLFAIGKDVAKGDWITYLMMAIATLLIYYFIVKSLIGFFREIEVGLDNALRTSNDAHFAAKTVDDHLRQSAHKYPLVNELQPRLAGILRSVLALADLEKVYHRTKAYSDLATQVAHDIRSPLTAIDTVVRTLPEIPAEKRQLLQNASARINGIANDLLDRYKSGRSDINSNNRSSPGETQTSVALKPVVISELLRSIATEKAAIAADRRNVTFKVDVTRPLDAVCEVDEKELARAISNLINNAIESLDGHSDDEVTLALRPSGKKEIAIIISDNGKGIPEDVLARLGKEQISAGKEGTESGSGIGVFHAARSVEAMGGKFVIQSKIGLGTMITIRLPRAIATAAADELSFEKG